MVSYVCMHLSASVRDTPQMQLDITEQLSELTLCKVQFNALAGRLECHRHA